MAAEKLRGEAESQKQQWYEHALEEIVDLMRGELQPQDDVNLSRNVIEEREQPNGTLREPHPDMKDFKDQKPVWLK